MKNIKMLLLLTVILCPLWAQKVEVTSDNMRAVESKKEVHFIGNAKVTQLENWIHGDEIIIYFNDNNETEKYVASGNVTFEAFQKEVHYKGKAEKVTYFPQKTLYILSGKAVIDDLTNKRHVNGDEITLDMTTGNANVKGDKKKPVKFIFNVEEKRE